MCMYIARVCVFVYLCAYMFAYVCVYLFVCTYFYKFVIVNIFSCIYGYVDGRVRMCAYLCSCVRVHFVYLCMCIYKYDCI